MKEIKAYIHNNRFADVIRSLKESGQCKANACTGQAEAGGIYVSDITVAIPIGGSHE